MILDLDVGNSRIKWRLLDCSKAVCREGVSAGLKDLLGVLSCLPLALTRVRVSCVGRESVVNELNDWLCDRGFPTCEIARAGDVLAGVRNGYRNPRQLGVDRWLALCAAYRLVQGACIVVDAGSAVTLDVVDDAGQHRGGFIVPGLRLLREALRGGTQRVTFPERSPQSSLALGDCTQAAVHHGIVFMLTGMLEKAVCDYPVIYHCEFPLILTGGDAPLLGSMLKAAHRIVPDLVFQGIEIALP